MKKLFTYILNLFPDFRNKDKVLHLVIGALVAVSVYLVTKNAYLALSGTIIIAIFKEAWDYNNSGYVNQENVIDFLVTVAGGLLVFLMVL